MVGRQSKKRVDVKPVNESGLGWKRPNYRTGSQHRTSPEDIRDKPRQPLGKEQAGLKGFVRLRELDELRR